MPYYTASAEERVFDPILLSKYYKYGKHRGLTVEEFARSGWAEHCGGKILRDLEVRVIVGNARKRFLVDPQDPHWYARLCSQICQSVGAPHEQYPGVSLSLDGKVLDAQNGLDVLANAPFYRLKVIISASLDRPGALLPAKPEYLIRTAPGAGFGPICPPSRSAIVVSSATSSSSSSVPAFSVDSLSDKDARKEAEELMEKLRQLLGKGVPAEVLSSGASLDYHSVRDTIMEHLCNKVSDDYWSAAKCPNIGEAINDLSSDVASKMCKIGESLGDSGVPVEVYQKALIGCSLWDEWTCKLKRWRRHKLGRSRIACPDLGCGYSDDCLNRICAPLGAPTIQALNQQLIESSLECPYSIGKKLSKRVQFLVCRANGGESSDDKPTAESLTASRRKKHYRRKHKKHGHKKHHHKEEQEEAKKEEKKPTTVLLVPIEKKLSLGGGHQPPGGKGPHTPIGLVKRDPMTLRQISEPLINAEKRDASDAELSDEESGDDDDETELDSLTLPPGLVNEKVPPANRAGFQERWFDLVSVANQTYDPTRSVTTEPYGLSRKAFSSPASYSDEVWQRFRQEHPYPGVITPAQEQEVKAGLQASWEQANVNKMSVVQPTPIVTASASELSAALDQLPLVACNSCGGKNKKKQEEQEIADSLDGLQEIECDLCCGGGNHGDNKDVDTSVIPPVGHAYLTVESDSPAILAGHTLTSGKAHKVAAGVHKVSFGAKGEYTFEAKLFNRNAYKLVLAGERASLSQTNNYEDQKLSKELRQKIQASSSPVAGKRGVLVVVQDKPIDAGMLASGDARDILSRRSAPADEFEFIMAGGGSPSAAEPAVLEFKTDNGTVIRRDDSSSKLLPSGAPILGTVVVNSDLFAIVVSSL
jgi:hypothetical protein